MTILKIILIQICLLIAPFEITNALNHFSTDKDSKTINWARNKSSEIRIFNKDGKTTYWKIEHESTKIEFKKIMNTKNLMFRIDRREVDFIKTIKGTLSDNKINIRSVENNKYVIFYNINCDTNSHPLNDWAKELLEKTTFEASDKLLEIDTSCSKANIKILDNIFSGSRLINLKSAFTCLNKNQNNHINVENIIQSIEKVISGNFRLSCRKMPNGLPAFFSEKENLINIDPSVFTRNCTGEQCSTNVVKELIHELTHSSEIRDEQITKNLTREVSLNYENQKCTNGDKFLFLEKNIIADQDQEKTRDDVRLTEAKKAADANLINQTDTATTLTIDTAAARSVQRQFEESMGNFKSPTTQQDHVKYIAASKEARDSAMTLADYITKAVGKAIIPEAHAETLTDSSKGSSLRYSGTNNGSTPTAASLNKVAPTTGTQVATRESKVGAQKEVATSALSPNKPTEVGSNKAATPSSTTQMGASAKIGPNTQTRSPSSVSQSGSGGAGSVGDSGITKTTAFTNKTNERSSANLGGGKHSAQNKVSTNGIIEYIQQNQYEVVKKRLLDEDFQQELIDSGITIKTLDGLVYGAKNGKILFSDRKSLRKFVKESR